MAVVVVIRGEVVLAVVEGFGSGGCGVGNGGCSGGSCG